MIEKYRKIPVEVECIQWTPDNLKQCKEFVGTKLRTNFVHQPYIETLEGNMFLTWNDYIIKGVNGEFYPCKLDIFKKTYEEVND